jgi:hypothetical protein
MVPIVALFAAFPFITWLGLPPRVGLALGGVIAVDLFTWLVWTDHRTHPAGVLSLGGGRLRVTAWGGRPIDVAVSEIRRAVAYRFSGTRPAVLVLWLPWRRVYIHEPRLVGHRIDDVLAAIREASVQAGTAEELATASSRTGVRKWQIRRAAVVLASAVVLVELLRLATR